MDNGSLFYPTLQLGALRSNSQLNLEITMLWWSGVVKYKMKSCNDGRNVSNDGEDDAYDTLPGHNHFLVLP